MRSSSVAVTVWVHRLLSFSIRMLQNQSYSPWIPKCVRSLIQCKHPMDCYFLNLQCGIFRGLHVKIWSRMVLSIDFRKISPPYLEHLLPLLLLQPKFLQDQLFFHTYSSHSFFPPLNWNLFSQSSADVPTYGPFWSQLVPAVFGTGAALFSMRPVLQLPHYQNLTMWN